MARTKASKLRMRSNNVAGHLSSVDDAISLLDTLLLLSALQLAFSITAMQSIEHGDLVDADKRYIMTLCASNPEHSKKCDFLEGSVEEFPWIDMISFRYMRNSFTAITFNLVALSIGISAYISLSYSDCREDPTFFAFWWRVWRFVIFAGYVVFAAGLHAFFSQNHSFVDAVYPHYANPPVYNTTAGEIEESKGWHLQSEANKLANTSKICFWVVYSVGFAIHLMQLGYVHLTADAANRNSVDGTGEAMKNDQVLSPSPNELCGAADQVTLRELVDFYERKLLTEEEFKVAKMKLLGMDVLSVVRDAHRYGV